MRMNSFFVFLACQFLVRIDISGQQPCESSPICWDAGYRLEWDDFQGVVPDSHLSDNVYAITSCNIEISILSIGDTFDFQIQNRFLRCKSWTKGPLLNFLEHEQLHFDISELYARKMRKAVDSLDSIGCSILSSYTDEFERILGLSDEMNEDYDIKTSYGNDTVAQGEWTQLVKKKLIELERYASNSGSCLDDQ